MFGFQNQGKITYPQYRFSKLLKISDTYTKGNYDLLGGLLSTVLVIINSRISAELINTSKGQMSFVPDS